MRIKSDFEHGGIIPVKYTCDGADIAPEIEITEVPSEARSLALIVDDPDAPMVDTWVHWVLYNLPSDTKIIKETDLPKGATVGMTNFGFKRWGGPCPPNGEHRYYFNLYAIDRELNLPEGLNKAELERAIKPYVIEKSELMGRYDRIKH